MMLWQLFFLINPRICDDYSYACFQQHYSLFDYVAQVLKEEFLFDITSNPFLQVADAFQLLSNLYYYNFLVLF